MEKLWTISGNELLVSNQNGSECPDAETIFRIFVEGNIVDSFPRKEHHRTLPHSFSSFPVRLQVRLVNDDPGHGFMLKCFAIMSKDQCEVGDIFKRKADHIIIHETWYPFAKGEIETLKTKLNEAGINSAASLSLKQIIAYNKLALNDDRFTDESDISQNHSSLYFKTSSQLPNVNATLYPYQLHGWKWLRYVFGEKLGAILADEMGLGKTLQIISLLSSENREIIFPALVIAPSTLLENWRREICKFSPEIKCQVHQGPKRTGSARELLQKNVIISSYDTIVRDYSLFNQVEWNIIILDEAQAVKNPEAKRTQTLKKLNKKMAIAVTGTPVENNIKDLWSLFDLVLPGYLGTQREFEMNFDNSPDGASRLEPYVRPLMLRRRVAEVAHDLPPRIEIPQAISMPDQETNEYENIRIAALNEFKRSASLVALLRLRQFCTHPFLLQSADQDPAMYSEKYRRLLEIIEEIFLNNEKVLIFTSYQKMSDILVEDITIRFSVNGAGIDGRTNIADRQKIVDDFSALTGPAFLALNPKAAGSGLNITAANHVIHYNLEWNPAVEDQASARSHRRGQTLPVTIHRLFYADTVEEAIDMRLSRKRNIAGNVVTGVEGKEEEYNDIAKALKATPIKEA